MASHSAALLLLVFLASACDGGPLTSDASVDVASPSTVENWVEEVGQRVEEASCHASNGGPLAERLDMLESALKVRRERALVDPSQTLLALRDVEEALACLGASESKGEVGRKEHFEAEKVRLSKSLRQRLTGHYALYRRAVRQDQGSAALLQVQRLREILQGHEGKLAEQLKQREQELRRESE